MGAAAKMEWYSATFVAMGLASYLASDGLCAVFFLVLMLLAASSVPRWLVEDYQRMLMQRQAPMLDTEGVL